MKKRIILIAIMVSPFISLGKLTAQNIQGSRPNIVLILADDLGFSDLGCYGGEIHTPNIDSLAANGLRYAQFYNEGRCCPTRASLLTGLDPQQAGIGWMTQKRPYKAYSGRLSSNSVTLAEALKNAGYQTGMVGKWHVTYNISPDGPKDDWPLQRGFDKFWGMLPGFGSYFDTKYLYDGNTPVKAHGDFYLTDAITTHAIRYIRSFEKKRKPFFMYVAYTAPHYPIQARSDYIKKYKGKYAAGWDSLRIARYNRLMKTGLLPTGTLLSKRNELCYSWRIEDNRAWQESRMEVYAAMVEEMDENVGRIVQTLRKTGQLHNTVIIFLSDNGASSEGHLYNKIERSGAEWKSKLIPEFTKNGIPIHSGDIPGKAPGADTTFGSYGAQWACLSNTPFKGYKASMHEGGIATPFIVQWPDKIKDRRGIRFTIATVKDLMPTFLDLANGVYPDSIRNEKTIPVEGMSLVKTFQKDNPHVRTLCWEHEGNRAIRKGKWKLVSEYPGQWRTLRHYPLHGAWELYNMEKDRTETHNLANQYPKLVKELAAEWQQWADRVGVIKWGTLGGVDWY